MAKRHKKGQPVLLGTASVESSEVVSSLLDVAKIPHQVLNAKQHDKEAAVVAVAGRKGAVTVATNMAGRGTDIMLGGNVEFLADAKLKSKAILRMTLRTSEKRWPGTLAKSRTRSRTSMRKSSGARAACTCSAPSATSPAVSTTQLRGRSGRQGDPVSPVSTCRWKDDLMRLFNTQLVARVMAKGMAEGQPIEAKSLPRACAPHKGRRIA